MNRMPLEGLFSSRAQNIKASEIREILKLTQQPDIISFAGGLPAPDLFPIKAMQTISQEVLETMGVQALQYNPTEGYDPLRDQIIERMKKSGIDLCRDEVLVTAGSQQGLDFSGKIFLDKDDIVLCESPSYLGAINAFKAYECQFREIETDQHGMVLADLERALTTEKNVKMIYVIPDFQNPSGRTWSLERRQGLIELANRHNVIVLEDNPYGELRYDGEAMPSIKSLDTEGRVVYLGTFSKTFCPGLRIGWVAANEPLISKYVMVKQGADLQTNSMSQRELSLFIEKYDFDGHIDNLIALYRERRDVMIGAMRKYFPKEAVFEVPQGGLFIWVSLPASIDTKALMQEAVAQKVAYVPGDSFFPNAAIMNTMRLNFSNMSPAKIEEGIERLGRLLSDTLASSSNKVS